MGKTRKNHAMHKMTLDSFCAAMFAGVLSISAFAAAGTAAGPLEVEFDTSGAPELEKWTNEKLAPVVREWYPKLVEMFPSEGWKPHRKVVFCFKEGIDCPAYASGSKVVALRSWFKDNPDDIGCAIHELFHVVQGGYRKSPKWLVEGLADYVRWYLFEPESKGCDYDVKAGKYRYNGSYRVSANFLDFVERRHPGTVKELNALCRRGKYEEKTFWKKWTGKSVLQLEDEWKGRRAAAEAPAVRVMTYNVRNSSGDRKSKVNNWKSRRVDFAHVIESENPDIIGFQEVLPDQRKWLEARFRDFAFSGKGRNADRKSGEASPVAYRKSRFDLVRTGTFWLSQTPDVPGSKGWDAAMPRICTYAVLRDKATGRTFSFANTHTDHIGVVAREKGMLLIIDRMKQFGKGAPIVFTGDHNCLEYEKPARAVAKVLNDAIYLSKTPPEGSWRTFNYWNWREKELTIVEALKRDMRSRSVPGGDSDMKRIDYIYVTPGTEVLDFRTVSSPRPGLRTYPSDHFPTVATVVFPQDK